MFIRFRSTLPRLQALRSVTTLIAMVVSALALAADAPPLPSEHSPSTGQPFFLLTDASFSSQERPRVRLELNEPRQLEDVGGVDIAVYRVPDPLSFLQRQRNLHRIQVDAPPAGEGLANTLTYLWDNLVVKSRLAWQNLFSGDARRAVTSQAPTVKTNKDLLRPSAYEEPRQFRPIPGMTAVERFRYPVQFAKAIAPPKGAMMEGSSSQFIQPSEGNVYVPLAAQKPGLYLVEAAAGQHRATALLFVSDTLALTKVSTEQMLVWTARRSDGAAVPQTRVVWTDGVGVLRSGKSDERGVAVLEHRSPEQTYVFGEDPSGGVFISENFYYDSEIYNAKVYAVTDRPLYRPGDSVQFKVTGREFKNARTSNALADGELGLTVLDPAGQLVSRQSLKFLGASGANGQFQLPDNAPAGGYELRLSLRDEIYTAAFRVADYQKPHFEVMWLPDKADFATGDKVSGQLLLAYPDGKPVVNARVSITARAQVLSMVDGELDYSGAFPVKLTQEELRTDGSGRASFELPTASQPSRYVLTALATDGAAYRVRVTRELLIERGQATWKLAPRQRFSKPGETMQFAYSPSARATEGSLAASPVSWEWLRLEDRSKATGKVDGNQAGNGEVSISFAEPGTYTVTLRDARSRVVAATNHWVSGPGLKAPAGGISIVFNRSSYAPGDTAEALITFPDPVAQALLTLERDQVEATALLTQGGNGLRTERIGPTQWKLSLKVSDSMSPNITLSVATVNQGDAVFENQGLRVEQAQVALSFKTDKAIYAPGDTVKVEVSTQVRGKPVAAEVAVGVVDEMIYVLQPEIAPSIDEFFYHPRRDNVRTAVSLNFIGYDLATRKLGNTPSRRQVNERAIKVLERPRRDNIDTAAWVPSLRTGADGRASFSFVMPDSLTRWRITGRAMEAGGLVGQRTAWLRSDKAFYAKWTSPDWQREGDVANATLALFNQSSSERDVEWSVIGGGVHHRASLKLKPGANFVQLPLAADKLGALDLAITLRADGKVADSLKQPLQRQALAWSSLREQVLNLASGSAPLKLPADARQLRVLLATDPASAAFSRWMDDLIDDPYGCVEQTASRMVPLSMALQSLSASQQGLAAQLTQRLATARLSLAQMAGPQARFGWWGRGMKADGFITAYAYYADWRAAQALHLSLPDSHWQRLLEVYAQEGANQPVLQRALALHWMQEMGLPVAAMQAALLDDLMSLPAPNGSKLDAWQASVVMVAPDELNARDLALLLGAYGLGTRVSPAQRSEAEAAAKRLANAASPLVQSLLLLTQGGGAERARSLLAQVRGEQPSFDRAQALLWLHKALGGRPTGTRMDPTALAAPWIPVLSPSGDPAWRLAQAASAPEALTLAPGAKAAVAYVTYESASQETGPGLPVKIERKLFRVVPQEKPAAATGASTGKAQDATGDAPDDGRLLIKLEPVPPSTVLDSNALYLDQFTLRADRSLRWGLLEAALPPGAAVEAITWGLNLADGPGGKTTPLERAVHQPIAQGYAVPVESLAAGESVTLRHLVRFSQRGQFKLPPARLYRMYQPEAKAVEAAGRGRVWDVR